MGISAADERADGDGLVEVAIETDEADASAVGTPAMGLQFGDQLHGPYLWSTAEGSCREGIGKSFDWVTNVTRMNNNFQTGVFIFFS